MSKHYIIQFYSEELLHFYCKAICYSKRTEHTFLRQYITMYDTKSQTKKQDKFHSIESEQQTVQNRRKMSFSPMKGIKYSHNNAKPNQKIQPPPVTISSYTPQQNQQPKPLANPQQKISFLFQYQTSKGGLAQNKRSEEEISLIMKLIEGNRIWTDLGYDDIVPTNPSTTIPPKTTDYHHMIKDICNSIVLAWSQIPNITQTKPNQLYLILQGKSFEYIRNENLDMKMKIHENNDYIMIRKHLQNDYFYAQQQGRKGKGNLNRYGKQKYQLMVDEKTLIGKISDQLFSKYIQKRLNERIRNITHFMRRITLFSNLPDNVFHQLSKFTTFLRVLSNTPLIRQHQKSKQVYFIKSGNIEFTAHSVIQDQKQQQRRQNHQIEILRQYDVFGMDTLHTLKTIGCVLEFEAKSVTDCELYCVDKRILAIVIASFQKEFRKKQRVVKAVDINAQIKGQNYISKRQFLLNQNAQRIKTSQKKVRDLKLRSYSRNNKQRQINTHIPQKDRVNFDRNAQTKSSQSKFRSSAGFKLLKSKSMKSHGQVGGNNVMECSDSNFWKLKKSFESKYEEYEGGAAYNQMVLPVTQDEGMVRKTLTTFSSASYREFQKIHKKSLKAFSPALASSNEKSKSQLASTIQPFIPKVQSRASIYEGNLNSGKIESDLIKNYIEKKLKEELVKKAQDILDKKTQSQRSSIKNIKKFFNTNSFSPSKKADEFIIRAENMTRKQLTDDLFDRMANIRDHPLLSLIETQRKKLDLIPKDKIPTRKQPPHQNPKARFNQQQHNLFTNTQQSTFKSITDRQV